MGRWWKGGMFDSVGIVMSEGQGWYKKEWKYIESHNVKNVNVP